MLYLYNKDNVLKAVNLITEKIFSDIKKVS